MISFEPAFGAPEEETRTRPIGRFFVSYFSLNEKWHELVPLFAGMVILRTEVHGERNAVEYIALSEAFDAIPFDEKPPQYMIEASQEQDEPPRYRFTRIPDAIPT